MKKILFLLLSTVAMYGQVPADATPLENIQITNNTQSTTATKVNVQEANGTINTISKSDLVNVVEVNDVPSLPLIGEAGKIYVVKNVNKIYRWNGTYYTELAGSDISGKEDIANKQNSLSVDGSNTKYPTVTAVNTGLGLKENILNNPITGVGSQNNVNTYALQDGTVLYHSAKWFVPSGAVSTIGATVTSVGTQFTSAMVGAKLIINGEWRIITGYTSSTVVTVASAYSQNYSAVVAGNWGVFSKAIILQLGVVKYYTVVGELYMESSGTTVNVTNLATKSGKAFFGDGYLSGYSGQVIQWTATGTGAGAKDIGIRRNSAGVLEIYDGITPTGLEANRRDLLARNLFGSKVLIGSIVDDNVNQGQYTGTVSSGTTALGNTPPTANNQLTRKDYVDTGLALKANLASPSFTGTPTAPTPTAGSVGTQIATTAFVAGGLATKENAFTKNTAFNKNFGTTAGTVADGGYSPSKTGVGATGTWGINISGSSKGLGTYGYVDNDISTDFDFAFVRNNSQDIKLISKDNFKSALGLGSNAYTSTAYLPLAGGTLTGGLNGTSANFTSSVTATSFNGSATLTGTPTAPTAAAGANTTQVATTAFVANGIATADAGNVKLTGNQTISGQKSFSLTGKIDMQTNNAFPAIIATSLGSNGKSAAVFINDSSSPNSKALILQTGLSGGVGNMALDVLNTSPIGTGIFSKASNGGVSISSESHNGDSYVSNITYGGTGRNYVGRNDGIETYSVDKTGNVIGNSYIKRSTPANNILLAGGGDLAQGTAFNKNFGTTAGTVADGNDARILNGQTAFGWGNHSGKYPLYNGTGATGTWGINISGSSKGLGTYGYVDNDISTDFDFAFVRNNSQDIKLISKANFKSALGLGSNAYSSTAYLPLSGGTLAGIVTAPTAALGTNTTQIATTAFVQANSRPYKVYTALLTQTGTNAPTATVLENTLGGSVVWTRTSTGSYLGTLTGVFTANKTFCTTTIGAYLSGGSNSIGLVRNSVDDVFLFTNRGIAGTDAILNDASIEIRVYDSPLD